MHTIQVFEHEILPVGNKFKKAHLKGLSNLNALHGYCYFDLLYNGVKFKNYVGVIQIDDICIEVLPKLDRSNDTATWQRVLIDMLRATRKLQVQKTTKASLMHQQKHLLHIYFEWFLSEIELLLHNGLIKQYRTTTKNLHALKGKLEFAGHLRQNIIHKERFYTKHQVYDKDHLVHQILSVALSIIEHMSKGTYLYHYCKKIQLDFPEVTKIKVSQDFFKRIPQTRKTAPYRTALQIARLIILNYAPNVNSGKEDMIAIMFDMNALWEEYVLVQLKKASIGSEYTVLGQDSKRFWRNVTQRPDIVIRKGETTFVIDTKWKNIGYNNPTSQDLRQMFVYNDYWEAVKSFLLYPTTQEKASLNYSKFDKRLHSCGVGKINVLQGERLNPQIGVEILNWLT